ncbi:MAG: cell division protein ZapE [Pseudomonadota bacterium]
MGKISSEYRAAVASGAIVEDPAQAAVLPIFDSIAESLEAQAPAKRGLAGLFSRKAEAATGLYLWGGVGRGKSYLMDMFVDHVGIDAKRRVHFHAFMQEIHGGMAAARKRDVDDALAPVAKDISDNLRLLAFDEMQITDITDAMIVGRLFEALFEQGVTVVTTSNRVPDDLYKDGLNRQLFVPFIDLIKSRLTVHELASPTDHRQNRLAGEPVYFCPIDRTARAHIRDIWESLTGGGTEVLELTVQGRKVELPEYKNGMARASFWQLCSRPLGPADYLAVANALRVLVLEEIPQLGSHNYNEAKRFVTLVDALYEARVRLIASAAAEPESLYVEGAGSFEFERTASRLREMQSADWGRAA